LVPDPRFVRALSKTPSFGEIFELDIFLFISTPASVFEGRFPGLQAANLRSWIFDMDQPSSNDDGTGTGNVTSQTVREAVEAANLGIFRYDPVSGMCQWSDSLKRMVGLPPGQAESYQTFVDRLHPDDSAQAMNAVERALDPAGDGIYAAEFQMRRLDGSWFWVGVQGKATFGQIDGRRAATRLIGLVMDISERRRLLDHKDLLIREVNHRVKNALMTVTTLLDLQRKMEPDESVRARLTVAHGRVAAIANLQRHFYKGRTLARVEMPDYLSDLASDLVEHLECGHVRLEVDAQPMDLPSEVAVPIGLIVNELVTNACKHAFAEKRAGTIKIGLWRKEADILVQVEDDGAGMGASPGLQAPSDGLGMAVVRSMSSNLDGMMLIEPVMPAGTRISIRFPATESDSAMR
jgi:PAS domain S-box-containing protein